jgi:predicted amino acid dehydrogenase
MLVLDNFKAHLTQDVKEEIRKANTDLLVIPGGMASQLQALDVVINKPFKDNLRQL